MATTELTGAEDVAWDLSDLYEGGDDPRIEQDVEQTEAAAAAFRERYYGKIADLSAEDLRDAIEERERIESAFTRAIYYAHLWFSTDMADAPRGALVAKLTEKGAAIDTQLLFFGLELAALEDEQADALIASDALERWRHWLRTVRKFRPYVLTEPEEKILTEKAVSGFSAWDRLYDELLGAIRVDLDGTEIGFEEAMSKLYSADRDERRRASDAVTVALGPGLRTRTFIFNTIAVDRSIDDRLRGYTTWISARNLSNDTTDEAVQALVDAVVGRYEVVQRYYTLKAKLLGLERLSFYDRMAPLADDPTQIGWDEASEIVLGAFSDFSSETGRRRRAVLPRELDRRAAAGGEAAGRLLRDERPGRAPVRVHELHRRSPLGAHARARARARAPRVPGAAARPLQREHASDDGGDGVRLRRGAHVQAPPRRSRRIRGAGSTCSPAGSRTRSRRSSARSR